MDGSRRHDRRAVGLPALLTILVVITTILAAGLLGEFTADPVLDGPVPVTERTVAPLPSATPTTEPPAGAQDRLEIDGGTLVATALVIVLALLALLVRVILSLRRGVGDRRRDVERADLQPDGVAARLEERLPAWTVTARAALEDDVDTSDAVIRCWLELERSCAVAGAARRPTQTTSDFAASVSAALAVPAQALATLTVLYQRARFGRAGAAERLTTDDRDAALAAVTALSGALDARRASSGGHPSRERP